MNLHAEMQYAYGRREGEKALVIVCDRCGNREIGSVRVIRYGARTWDVLGSVLPIVATPAVTRRRVALGYIPPDEEREVTPDIDALVGKPREEPWAASPAR